MRLTVCLFLVLLFAAVLSAETLPLAVPAKEAAPGTQIPVATKAEAPTATCCCTGLALEFGIEEGWAFPLSNGFSFLNGGLSVGAYLKANSMVVPAVDVLAEGCYFTFTDKIDRNIYMDFIPVTLSAQWSFIDLGCMAPYVKLGGGVVFEAYTTLTGTVFNVDPIFLGGVGASMKLSDKLSLSAEAVFDYIYERYAAGATEDGYLLSAAAKLSYKF